MSKQQKSTQACTATLRAKSQVRHFGFLCCANNRTESCAAHCPAIVEASEVFQVRSVTSYYLHSYDSISNPLLKELVFLQYT
jgi:hypothetical protein